MAGRVKTGSQKVLGWAAVALSLLLLGFYIAQATGKDVFDQTAFVFPLLGILVGVLVITETGVMQYFSSSARRKFGLTDLTNIFAGGFGFAAIFQGILFIPFVANVVPSEVTTFFASIGIVIGIGASLASFVFLMKKD